VSLDHSRGIEGLAAIPIDRGFQFLASGSMNKMLTSPRTFKLNFVGDVMLGRLIDQLFPTHVDEAKDAVYAANFVRSHPQLKDYDYSTPWGSTYSLFLSSDLNLINLETSATTASKKWPNKVFNYRMHPKNIAALKAAKIDYASCANNHTLDFCEEGLVDTVRTLKREGIAFAGAGESRDEATRPAVLQLPRKRKLTEEKALDGSDSSHEVHIYSASDHPQDWGSVSSFHLIDYSFSTRERLKRLLNPLNAPPPALKIFSVHWGPNYSWHPSPDIHSLAHFLVDECAVDIIHGHSSHHVQGVEVYKKSLIIYGCGDFVDDYAVDEEYRNNMSAVWRVHVEEDGTKLRPKKLEVFPTAIRRFQAQRLEVDEKDHGWICDKVRQLSNYYDTSFERDLDAEGQMVLNV